ncbi:MAG TPA: hypothetical protein VGI80_02925 [Pyrinomonadaceae bacterium]|jgi:hypothetical protein
MGGIDIDYTKQDQSRPASTNTPLVVALVCALFLLALFIAVSETEGQGVTPNRQLILNTK